jgi:hypothetical protein
MAPLIQWIVTPPQLPEDYGQFTDTSTGLPIHTPHKTSATIHDFGGGPEVDIVGVGARTELSVYNITQSQWAGIDHIDADKIWLVGGNNSGDLAFVLWRANANLAQFVHSWSVQRGSETPVVHLKSGTAFQIEFYKAGTFHVFEILYVVDDSGANIRLGQSSTGDILVDPAWEKQFGRVLVATGIPKAKIDALIVGLPADCIATINAGYDWANA